MRFILAARLRHRGGNTERCDGLRSLVGRLVLRRGRPVWDRVLRLQAANESGQFPIADVA